MKTLALILGLCMASNALQEPPPTRETIREAYPDGSPRLEAEAVRGTDGELVLDGKYVRFHPDGSRECVGRYREGQRHGSWRLLHPGGDQKRAEGSYKGGWRDGRWKAWMPDGAFDPNESGTYRTLASKLQRGVRAAEGETLDHVPHGRWELRWPSGATMASGELRRGRLHGPWLFRHADGSLDPDWITGVYEGGRRVGDLPAGELPPTPAADLARLPAPESHGDLPVGLVEASRAAVQRLGEALRESAELDDGHEPDTLLLARLGPEVHDLLLAPLIEADLGAAAGALAAVRWERTVLAVWTNGECFGLRAETDPETQAWNRLCVLRWHSLLALGRAEPYVLEFELRLRTTPDRADPQAAAPYAGLAQRTPSLPFLGLDSDAARAAMHPRVAPRLASQRPATKSWGKEGAPALDAALAWLVAHQASDGRWSGARFMEFNGLGRTCTCDGPGHEVHDVGLTGLALLALMGDGSSPRHGRHAPAVRRGVAFLVGQQTADGLVGPSNGHGFLYDHAIATQALGEAAALCDEPVLRFAARRAIDVCLAARNPKSAWRYELAPNNENDTSVTGWMVAALKAGEAAGLEVDSAAYQGALRWIDKVTDTTTGRCGYDTVGSLSARIPRVNEHFPAEKGEAMTAVALLCRQWIAPEADTMLAQHAALLLQRLPGWDESRGNDMYYWYHGTLAMQRRGGTDWLHWSKALNQTLIGNQRQNDDFAGSWDPVGPWGYSGGRVYATALMALCLEAPFRYASTGSD